MFTQDPGGCASVDLQNIQTLIYVDTTATLGCSVGNYSCFCADDSGTSTQSSIISSSSSCIQDACSLIDANTTLKVVGQICVLINAPTSSTSSSFSTISSASSSSATSSQSGTTTAVSMMTSISVTATPTLTSTAPYSTSTSSSSLSRKGISDVAKAMIILAVVAFLLILAIGARLLWKRRASQRSSLKMGKFRNLDEENGMAKTPVELQGDDTQIFKWGGIGVRKSFRVQTQRITSLMSPTSPKNRRRSEFWGEPRGLLSTIEETSSRGLAQSPELPGRIDTSPIRWPSTSTANSPTSPEMTEPQGALFPPSHFRSNAQTSPPTLPALNLPSIILSTTSRPNTPDQPLPKTPSPPEVPVKTIARLDRPFSDFPHAMPPSPRTIGISYGALARSLSVSENHSPPRTFRTRSRSRSRPSISSISNVIRTPTHDFTYPLQSPSAQSFHTFGARNSTYSQASVSTFQTFPISPQDITEVPPLPTMPSIYPMPTDTSASHNRPKTSESIANQNGRYYHSKQTSVSKIKPKMIYISTTPGISIMPSDSIFSTPSPILRDAPSSTTNPFITPTPPHIPSTPNPNPNTPAISIKPVIDRFDTISSCGSQSSSGKPKLKPPAIEQMFQEGQEKERFRERQDERRMKRKDRLLHGQGSGDLGERVTSWYDATG
ncbi:hypothetical protein SBOR_0488 [Sclerotinia borealis F-4128]|uniref:Extracellular membrane protein CFEM domain-containing protein n=1 Tax=Sclerotinia borealis (strain F-4128) TaxID=1432307 RepID=W9CSH6_SCLBF|nr:hypothetical protein SBOR_0488 [Sclerotinia borealis F-4128]